MIKPTVGRIVHFYPAGEKGNEGPFAAIITHVWSDTLINIAAFDWGGNISGHTSVYLAQPGDEGKYADDHCEWMPYQVKKGFGSESGEKEAGTEKI